MSNDYFSIGYESEASWGNSRQSQVILPIPENKREIPCEGCPNAAKCEDGFLECSAFRNWASTGDYKNSDVQRYIRAAK